MKAILGGNPRTLFRGAAPTGSGINALGLSCTTYGPRAKSGQGKLLMWPTSAKINCSLLVCLIETPLE